MRRSHHYVQSQNWIPEWIWPLLERPTHWWESNMLLWITFTMTFHSKRDVAVEHRIQWLGKRKQQQKRTKQDFFTCSVSERIYRVTELLQIYVPQGQSLFFFLASMTFGAIYIMDKGRKILEKHLDTFIKDSNQHEPSNLNLHTLRQGT